MNLYLKKATYIICLLIALVSCGESGETRIGFEVVEQDPLNEFLNSYKIKIKVKEVSRNCPTKDVSLNFNYDIDFIYEDGLTNSSSGKNSFPFGSLPRDGFKTKSFDLLNYINESTLRVTSLKVSMLDLKDVSFERDRPENSFDGFFYDVQGC